MKGVNNMKYKKPTMDVVTLDEIDIIRTSDFGLGGDPDAPIPMPKPTSYNFGD